MADMRASDWITIGIAGLIIIACLFGTMVLIAAWPHIVSMVSKLGGRMAEEGRARAAYRQRVYDRQHMSSQKVSRALFPDDSSWRSPALDRTSEQTGSGGAFHVPALWEQLGTLSDDELLDILARVKDANGNPKYADSRIAKFIGGRVEDRTNQVRDVRGTELPPPKAPAVLRVRDNGTERLIAKYGDKHPA